MPQSTNLDVVLRGALADPARLAIVRHLATHGQVCACDFAAGKHLTHPTLWHHLRVLRDAGAVLGERRGTWTSYGFEPGVAERLGVLGDELLAARPRSASALAGSMLRDRDSRNRPTELQ